MTTVSLEKLAGLLGRERLLLELVVFKLVELRQLLVAGETRFLGWAAEEVERAVAAVRDAELERAVLVAAIAADAGRADDDVLLEQLADSAPEPWRTMLHESREALRALTGEVADVLASARSLAQAGAGAVRTLLDGGLDGMGPADPEPPLATYGPQATWQRAAPAPRVQRTL